MHDLLDAQWVYDNTKDGNDNLCDLLMNFGPGLYLRNSVITKYLFRNVFTSNDQTFGGIIDVTQTFSCEG